MNQDSLTAKSQEALQKAIELAHQNSHQAIENVHVLLGIEQVDQHLFSYIINTCEKGLIRFFIVNLNFLHCIGR